MIEGKTTQPWLSENWELTPEVVVLQLGVEKSTALGTALAARTLDDRPLPQLFPILAVVIGPAVTHDA